MKRTAREIIMAMESEMPFSIPSAARPYIEEAMKIFANQTEPIPPSVKEAAEAANDFAFKNWFASGQVHCAEQSFIAGAQWMQNQSGQHIAGEEIETDKNAISDSANRFVQSLMNSNLSTIPSMEDQQIIFNDFVYEVERFAFSYLK